MKKIFATIEQYGSRLAFKTDNGIVMSYKELACKADGLFEEIRNERSLILIEACNKPEPLIAYIGALRAGHSVILVPAGSTEKDKRIIEQYKPSFVYVQHDDQWELCPTGFDVQVDLHPELALLLSTSGTTGATKMVTLSYNNLEANARSIAEYLNIDQLQRPITSLPLYYSYGLSVLNSHFLVGATILLTDLSLKEKKFWEYFVNEKATSFAGVPFSFEILERIKFDQMKLSSLQIVTQAGGRLSPELVIRYGSLAKKQGWQFFVMYGQTEATARIAYMPPDRILEFPDCIGKAIPRGQLSIIDGDGNDITDTGKTGQLIYQGPNVMMHYSNDYKDLIRGPEITHLETGDIASKNTDGFFKITGRMKRFLKLYGLRISLDEVEMYLSDNGYRTICGGNDELLAIGTLEEKQVNAIRESVIAQYSLPENAVHVLVLSEYPLLANGKTDYNQLLVEAVADKNKLECNEQEGREQIPKRQSIRKAFHDILGLKDIDDDDSFASLGGDSLTYVDMSLELEKILNVLPDKWEQMSIFELEKRVCGHKRKIMVPIRTDVALRAVAIVCVVLQHANYNTFGGAKFLIMLAGFNLARFQSKNIFQGNLLPLAKSMFSRVLIPYFVIIAIYQIYNSKFNISDWLLYSSWINMNQSSFLIPYWFIQAFIHCIVIISLICLLPLVKKICSKKSYIVCLLLVASGTSVYFILHQVTQDVSLLNYTLPSVFYLFSLGWCIYFTKNKTQRIITSAIVIILFYCFRNSGLFSSLLLLLSMLSIIWRPTILIPFFLYMPLTIISASIFYIYLFHTVPIHLFVYLVQPPKPIMASICGTLLGVLIWFLLKLLRVSNKKSIC